MLFRTHVHLSIETFRFGLCLHKGTAKRGDVLIWNIFYQRLAWHLIVVLLHWDPDVRSLSGTLLYCFCYVIKCRLCGCYLHISWSSKATTHLF